MKPISILLFVLASIFGNTTAEAQTSSTVTANIKTNIQQKSNGIDPKVYYQTKLSEFDVHTSRNSKSGAESVFKDLRSMMEEFMKDTELKMVNAEGSAKVSLQDKLKKQQNIYAEITDLSSELITNKDTIKQKLDEFLHTLY